MTSVPLLLALLAGSATAAEEPHPSLVGSGLLTLPDVRTLAPGRVTVTTTLHNRDRDPLGIDVFDYGLAAAVGVTPRIEAYVHGVFSRVVVVPDVSQTSPVLPPPPLDLVLPRGTPIPPRPYYPLYACMPYANGRGDQRFSDLVPGDLVFGLKTRLRELRERAPGVALSADLKVPLTRRLGALQSGSGTGGIDASLRLTTQWRRGRFDFVASGAYTHVGASYLPDRVVLADPNGAAVSEEPLRLPSRIEVGTGIRRGLSSRLALVAEAVATLEIAGGTRTLDAAPPLDLLLGIQTRAGRAQLTTGILYYAQALGKPGVRSSPLPGFVDLSRASEAGAREYLQQAGLAGAAPHLRRGVQVVAPLQPGSVLPTGARIIPDTYTSFSEHQIGFVLVVGWAF